MKKTTLAVGLVALALPMTPALAEVSQERDLEPFTKVEFDGLMDVYITVGDEQSFTVTANKEKYLDNIETRVRNGVLRVDMDEDDDGFFSIFRDLEVRIDITVTSLEYVEMDGLGNIYIKNVDSEYFELNLDGLGSVEIDGRCTSARITLDGMGDLDARDFKCENVRLVLDGMGDAEIYASKSVDIVLDGFGDVDVWGDPEDRRLDEDGMGDIDFN